MKIFKDVAKTFLLTLLIFLVVFGIPFIIHNSINESKYWSDVDGSDVKGPMGYLGLIINNENTTGNINENAMHLMDEETNIIAGQRDDFTLMMLVMGIIISITIISIGIILKKITKSKVPYTSFVISGILTLAAYVILYCIDVIYL